MLGIEKFKDVCLRAIRVQVTQWVLHHRHHGEQLKHGTRGPRGKKGHTFVINFVLIDLSLALQVLSCSSPPNLHLKNINTEWQGAEMKWALEMMFYKQ